MLALAVLSKASLALRQPFLSVPRVYVEIYTRNTLLNNDAQKQPRWGEGQAQTPCLQDWHFFPKVLAE